MEKRKLSLGWLAPTIVAALIPILFILLVASGDDDTIDRNSPYKDYVNYEWVELSCYEAIKDKYLGRRPEQSMSIDIFSGYIYTLKGIPENEMLYCKQPEKHGGESIEILMNTMCTEPITTIPFEKIEIPRAGKTQLTITDEDILNKIQQATTEIIGTESIWRYGLSFKVYFDVECELIGYCDFGLDEEGRLIMTYFNNKTSFYCHCDVTDLLMEEYQNN